MKIWDIRTGGIVETVKFDYGVSSLQFDTRKIVAAAGENGVKVRSFAIIRFCDRLIFTVGIFSSFSDIE